MALINKTIDDQFGDSVTGVLPTYRTQNSSVVWNAGATCTGCAFHPDPALAFARTWHDSSQFPGASGPVSVSLNFTGTAIEVFCIAPPLTGNLITDYHLNFTLDGGTRQGTFSYVPTSTTQYVYTLSVVALQGLENGTHELVVSTDDSDVGSVFLFDYAVYSVPLTVESKSKTSAGTIAGSLLGAIFIILGLVMFLRRKWIRKKSLLPTTQPFVGRARAELTSKRSPSLSTPGADSILDTSEATTTRLTETQSVSNMTVPPSTAFPHTGVSFGSQSGYTTPPPVYELSPTTPRAT